MGEKESTIGPIAAVAAILGLCCGLPLLAAAGAAGVVSGIGLGSWVIAAVASAVVIIGIVRSRRTRERCELPASHEIDTHSRSSITSSRKHT